MLQVKDTHLHYHCLPSEPQTYVIYSSSDVRKSCSHSRSIALVVGSSTGSIEWRDKVRWLIGRPWWAWLNETFHEVSICVEVGLESGLHCNEIITEATNVLRHWRCYMPFPTTCRCFWSHTYCWYTSGWHHGNIIVIIGFALLWALHGSRDTWDDLSELAMEPTNKEGTEGSWKVEDDEGNAYDMPGWFGWDGDTAGSFGPVLSKPASALWWDCKIEHHLLIICTGGSQCNHPGGIDYITDLWTTSMSGRRSRWNRRMQGGWRDNETNPGIESVYTFALWWQ